MDGQDLKAPITCTLGSADQRAERKRFRKSLLPHITDHKILPDGLRISFDANAVDRSEIDRLVRLDAGCCSFLTHKVEDHGSTITLTTTSQGDGIPLAQAFADEFAPPPGRFNAKTAMIGLVSVCGLACLGSAALVAAGTGTLALAISGVAQIVLLGLLAFGAIFVLGRKFWKTGKGSHADRGCC